MAERPVHRATYSSAPFGIILDTHGSLAWHKAEVQGDHLIVVTGAGVSNEYLVALADAGVSYIVASGERPNPREVLDILATTFDIKTLVLEGGAETNGSFFKAKVVDEVSYVLFPAIGGRTGSAAIFEAGEDGLADLVRLNLQHFEKVGCDAIHVRYTVSYTE